VSLRVSIEGQKAKKHSTTAECFFLLVVMEGIYQLISRENYYVKNPVIKRNS
jgi:hypothetical protein